MKLILTAEVDHLGIAGDAVEVKDGYGRNYLLPRGLAIVASRGAERQADEIRRAREIKTVRGLDHAKELQAALEALGPVSLKGRTAGDTGKLFGSVTPADVVSAIKKAGGPNLDKRTVQLRFQPTRGLDVPALAAAMPIFSEKYYSTRPFDETSLEAPLGSGPYRVARFEQGRYVQFERESDTPSEVIAIRYDTRNNLIARGIIHAPAREPNPFPARFVADPPVR